MATKDEVELVVARLRAIPENALVFIGSDSKPLNREELIAEVENGSDIGNEIIEMQMTFLRSLRTRY